jgi:hypothetical protein
MWNAWEICIQKCLKTLVETPEDHLGVLVIDGRANAPERNMVLGCRLDPSAQDRAQC